MNISQPFIHRPVMTTLVMLGVLIFGMVAFDQLPVSDLPTVDLPTIQVFAALPGASPETMASSVATVLERQFSTISGLQSMSSSSTQGTTSITLQFALDRDIDAAAQDVQASIVQAQRDLPPDLPSPPSYFKVNPADQPILYIALTSRTLPMSQVNEYAETTMAQQLSTVSGVSQVQVYGSQKYAVRVQLDPTQLAYRQIGIDEAAAAIRSGNVNLPTGVLQGPDRAFIVETEGQLTSAAQYRPLIVAYRQGQPVRLSQLGQIIDSVENDKTAAWYVDRQDQQRAIVLAVQRQPGTNTVQVADDVKAMLPRLRQQVPASVDMHILYDRSVSIRESVHDVEFTLVLTLGLVVMVIFLFLRNLTATIIPSLTLPMSIVGTFAVMYLLGYSLNNLTLMALTLSVGFVVDDAIVVLENNYRHLEMGKGRVAAALDGAREIGFTVVSMTISLAAVFIPVLFMGGILGRLFREFAVTIGVAVLISGVVSLTLTPMMGSRFLKPQGARAHGAIYRASERAFGAMIGVYGLALRVVLRHRAITMVILVAVLAGTVVLMAVIPKGFLPNEDRSQLFAFTEAKEGISFRSMAQHQQAVNAVIQKQPEVADFFSSTGSGRGLTAGNSGVMFIRLTPRDERELSADEVATALRPKLAEVVGMRVFIQNLPPIPIGGRLTKSQYQYTLTGADTDELFASARELERKMRDIPGIQDVTSDLLITNPQVNIRPRRDEASTYGVTVEQVETALFNSYGSREISTILAPNNQYRVILELLPQYQGSPENLSLLYIRNDRNQLVPLEAVADVDEGVGPLTINHTGQLPSVTISFNTAPDASLGTVIRDIDELSRVTLPPTVSKSFQGTAQEFQKSLTGLVLLLAVAIVVIYLVLGILYESFIHPLTILTSLPLAGFGALVTLLIFGQDLSLYAFVGLIMLVGLVKKNGIIMIDFALEQQRQGKSASQAIYDACLVRFRPIMMTTMAALMAGLPIALGFGAGAESRRPLGLAVVGGLVFSQTLTLFVTPVFFVLMDALQTRLGRRRVVRSS